MSRIGYRAIRRKDRTGSADRRKYRRLAYACLEQIVLFLFCGAPMATETILHPWRESEKLASTERARTWKTSADSPAQVFQCQPGLGATVLQRVTRENNQRMRRVLYASSCGQHTYGSKAEIPRMGPKLEFQAIKPRSNRNSMIST